MANKAKFDTLYLEKPEEADKRRLKFYRNKGMMIADAYISGNAFDAMMQLEEREHDAEVRFVKGDAEAFKTLVRIRKERRELEATIEDAKAVRKDFFGNAKVSLEKEETNAVE